MGEKFGRSGKTVQEIFWDLPEISNISFQELEQFPLPDPETISQSDLLSNMEEIDYYAKSVESSKTEFSSSFALFDSVNARIDDPFKLGDLVRILIGLQFLSKSLIRIEKL